jgi:hypothetical protein
MVRDIILIFGDGRATYFFFFKLHTCRHRPVKGVRNSLWQSVTFMTFGVTRILFLCTDDDDDDDIYIDIFCQLQLGKHPVAVVCIHIHSEVSRII